MVLIVLIVAAWMAWRSFGYITGNGVMRFQVESAAVLFLATGLLARLVRGARATPSVERFTISQTNPAWTLVLWWLLATALYWPALQIGLLSDDFVLADHASRWQIGLVSQQLFRPAPLAVWGLILRAGGGPFGLHVLNVLLHGTNAYLATRLIEAYAHDRAAALLGGLLVVAFPLSPEAVAWASGIFDVMATTCTLVGILVARGYGSSPSVTRRAALYASGAAALLSKETAAIMPLLIGLDMWATGRLSRTLLQDAGLLLAADASVGAIRLAYASQLIHQRISKFMIQRWLFGTFGSSALPWHSNVMHGMRWVVVAEALAVMSLLAAYLSRSDPIRQIRAPLAMAGWMLVSTVPVMNILGVAADLQGSRYLYLPSIGWAGLLACIASSELGVRRARQLLMVGTSIIAVTYLVGLPSHLASWRRAADLRDQVERAARVDASNAACNAIQVSNLPDNVDGAYVLRNGAAEAFVRDLGIRISTETVNGCSFSWDQKRSVLIPTVPR